MRHPSGARRARSRRRSPGPWPGGAARRETSGRLFENGGDLVLELQPLAPHVVFDFLGRRLDARLDAVDRAVYLMILVREFGEMGIGHLQIMDLLHLVREFLGQFVRYVAHRVFSFFESLLLHTIGFDAT